MSTPLGGKLIEAVGRVLRERGVAGLTLREVAREAGVSHSAPGFEFGSRVGMLTAYAAVAFEELGGQIQGELAVLGPADGPTTLEHIGRVYARFALADPDRFAVMFRKDLLDAANPRYVAASDAAFDLLRLTVQRCVTEGRIAEEEAEPVLVLAWSAMHGLVTLWAAGRFEGRLKVEDPEVLSEAVAHLLVTRVLPEPRRGKLSR